MPERLLTPDQAAERLAISSKTVRNWLREGRLHGVKVGRLWRLRERELEAFLPQAITDDFEPARSERGGAPPTRASESTRAYDGIQLDGAASRAAATAEPRSSGPLTPPGPPGEPVTLDEQALSKKQMHLLRSTYRVLAEKGLKELSLQHVADQAGVSKGILLYYFGSKENLILAAMRWVLGRVAERIRTAVFEARSAEEKVTAMLDAIFIDPKANRDFYLVFLDLLSTAARLDRFDEISATFRTTVNAVYAHIIEHGIEQGTFTITNANEAASVVRGIIDGLFLQWLQEADRDAIHERTRETCTRAVLAYLRSGRAARV
ncbi:MAG: helix-turn-helix domain-containing protein [Armatimonadota bacterium]